MTLGCEVCGRNTFYVGLDVLCKTFDSLPQLWILMVGFCSGDKACLYDTAMHIQKILHLLLYAVPLLGSSSVAPAFIVGPTQSLIAPLKIVLDIINDTETCINLLQSVMEHHMMCT